MADTRDPAAESGHDPAAESGHAPAAESGHAPAAESGHDSRVDDYLRPLPEWQQEILEQVREILHESDPELTETIKRTVQPYFVLDGNVAAFLAAKDHVNVFVYDGGIVPDPDGLITAGHDNQTARTIGFREGDDVRREPLLAFFRHLIADNRSGGWRKLKG